MSKRLKEVHNEGEKFPTKTQKYNEQKRMFSNLV